SANPFSSSAVRASPRIKAVRDSLSFKRRSTGMPNASASICPAQRGIHGRYRTRTRCCLSPRSATQGETGAFALLYHLPELVQRPQIIRSWLVSESLRPVGPRHLADIEVTVAVHRKPMRRQELGWTKARAKPA